jgi:hypothetical protein
MIEQLGTIYLLYLVDIHKTNKYFHLSKKKKKKKTASRSDSHAQKYNPNLNLVFPYVNDDVYMKKCYKSEKKML